MFPILLHKKNVSLRLVFSLPGGWFTFPANLLEESSTTSLCFWCHHWDFLLTHGWGGNLPHYAVLFIIDATAPALWEDGPGGVSPGYVASRRQLPSLTQCSLSQEPQRCRDLARLLAAWLLETGRKIQDLPPVFFLIFKLWLGFWRIFQPRKMSPVLNFRCWSVASRVA